MFPRAFASPQNSVNPSRHTAFVCGRKKLPFAGYSVVKDRWLTHSQGSPPRFVSFARTFYLTRLARPMQARREARRPYGLHKPNKVENTGLEPVTSWLLTRRSPS